MGSIWLYVGLIKVQTFTAAEGLHVLDQGAALAPGKM